MSESGPPSERLGRFFLERRLGAGGMGEVYLAHDPTLARQVAIKILRAGGDVGIDAEALAAEARAAAALNHPNIAIVHEVGVAPRGGVDVPYIVMEYVRGHSLWKHTGGKPMAVREIFDIGLQAAEALAAAHDAGIVHRDVKSENIIVGPEGRVKVLDFGLAKQLGGKPHDPNSPTRRVSGGGDLVEGTLSYMSPEQALGHVLDARTDVFSFGIVLYEMLTGRLPFDGATVTETLNNIVNKPAPALGERRDDTPAALERVLGRCLEKDRELRYASARDLAADLQLARREVTEGRRSASIAVGVAPVRRGRLRRAAWTAGGLLALVAAVFFVVRALPRLPAGAGGPPRSVAVHSFENLSRDPQLDWLERGLGEMFASDLAQVRGLSVVPPQHLADALRSGGAAPGASVQAARAAAAKLGVQALAYGSLAAVEDRLRIMLTLERTSDGTVLYSGTADGAGADVFEMVDRLTGEAGLRLGLAAAGGPAPSVARETTESLAAYRAFQQGRDAALRYYWREAVGPLEQAVDADPAFAVAWIELGNARLNLGDNAGGRAALERARALLPQAALRDRLYVDGHLRYLAGDRRGAIKTFERLVALAPRDKVAWRWLGYVYSSDGQTDRAISALRRALAIDPGFFAARNTLGYAYARREEYEAALAELTKVAEQQPNEANPFDSLGDILTRMGRWDEAIAAYRRAIAIKPDFSNHWPLRQIANVNMLRGDFATARASLDEYERLTTNAGRTDALLVRSRMDWAEGRSRSALAKIEAAEELAALEDDPGLRATVLLEHADGLAYLGRTGQAFAKLDEAAALAQGTRLAVGVAAARVAFYCRLERPREAQDALARYLRGEGEKQSTESIEVMRLRAAARLAASRGDWPRAVEAWRTFRERRHLTTANGYELGLALAASGDAAAARNELQRVVRRQGEGSFSPTAHSSIEWVLAHYHLGAACDKVGDRVAAAEAYRRFLELWGKADFPVPEVAAARRRLAAGN